MPASSGPVDPSRLPRAPRVPQRYAPRPPSRYVVRGGTKPRSTDAAFRLDQILLLILLANLIAVVAIAIRLLPYAQIPPILGVGLWVAAGLILGMNVMRQRHWLLRGSVIAAGVALGAAAWWFVPAIDGLNRWQAQALSAQLSLDLEHLPVGDGKAYLTNREARDRLTSQFPEFEPAFSQPARVWEERSLDHWERELDKLPAGDLAGMESLRAHYEPFLEARLEEAELQWFERSYGALKADEIEPAAALRLAGRPHDLWEDKLGDWEDQWSSRAAAAAIKDAKPYLETDPMRASRNLRQFAIDLRPFKHSAKAVKALHAARREAFKAVLHRAQEQACTHVADEQYQTAADLANRLSTEMEREAKDLGVEGQLESFREGFGFLADLARQAKKSDSRP